MNHLKRTDKIWAKMIESVDGNPCTVIPRNIVDGVLLNLQQTKQTLIPTNWMVKIVPKESQTITGHFCRNFDPDKIKRRRSINTEERNILRFKPSLVRIEPRFEGNINSKLLFKLAAWQFPSKLINWSWFYCRMAPITRFEFNLLSKIEVQVIPQRTGFNTFMSIIPYRPSPSGYVPFIPTPPIDMSAFTRFLSQ